MGRGAEKHAQRHGFARKNMLTQRAMTLYHERVKELSTSGLRPYMGHDTVGMLCLDQRAHMSAATSTSGLFMKRAGRVGDSPVIGSGLYVDSSVGGASATGLGEDLMKGCISYEIVRLMREGKTPQEACDEAVIRFDEQLKRRRKKAGDMSLIAMNNKGEWGVVTNIDTFSFVVATKADPLQVYLAKRDAQGHTRYEKASAEWIKEYVQRRSAPCGK